MIMEKNSIYIKMQCTVVESISLNSLKIHSALVEVWALVLHSKLK